MRSFKVRLLIYLVIFLLLILQIRFELFYKRVFRPATPAEIAAAPGDLSGVAPVTAKAFSPAGGGFTPISPDIVDDYECWLASHYEAGQTFDEYAASSPNVPNKVRNVIYLQPIAPFTDEAELEKLRIFTETFFAMSVKTNMPIETKACSRINAGTRAKQLLSTDILAELRALVPNDAYCVLGITSEDLYPEESWNFVFGQAMLSKRVGVYSLARYDQAFAGGKRKPGWKTLYLKRSLQVLAHEAFHMFGVHHCIFYRCLMNGANSLYESDASPLFLCPVCLRKLYHVNKFDPVTRYEKLRSFYSNNCLTAEVEWLDARIRAINTK